MDKTDVVLIQLLLSNSRLSYAELAEKQNLSVNAVHKRIQLLIEAGVIRKFTAKVSALAANGIIVFVFGTSTLSSFQALPSKLATHGSIYWLALGGGKYLYVGAYLRSINDLGPLVSYLEKEAGLNAPTVGIMTYPIVPQGVKAKPSDMTLCKLDLQIVKSLKDNSRKPISEVAEELGVSAKTARRRLSRMIKNNLIELSVEWYPDTSNDIMTLIDVRLKPETDVSVVYRILTKYSPHILFFWQFANFPNAVTYAVWTNTMKELQSIRENLEKEEGVLSVVLNILYSGYIFSTWRDTFPEEP